MFMVISMNDHFLNELYDFRVLLDFLRDLIPDSRMRVEIRNELKFYDLNSSPLYRFSK